MRGSEGITRSEESNGKDSGCQVSDCELSLLAGSALRPPCSQCSSQGNIAWLSTYYIPSSPGLCAHGMGESSALLSPYGKFLPSLRVLAEMSPLQRAPVPFGHPCHRVCPLPDTVMILLSLLVLLTPVWNIVEQAGVSGFLSFSVVPGTEKAY